MIRCQQRDEILLNALTRFGILSNRQINAWIFENVAQTTVLRRLRLLEQNSIIKNSGHLPNGMKVWTITQQGAKVIGLKPPFKSINHNTVVHDVLLSEVRNNLECNKIASNWVSQSDLKRNLVRISNTAVVPDGLFLSTYLGAPTVVALELELHTKSHQRYIDLFLDYTYKTAIGVILYVVKNSSIAVPIRKSWIKANENTIIDPFKRYCLYN